MQNRTLASTLTRLAFAACAGILASVPAVAQETASERPAQWATPIDAKENLYRITPTFYRSARLDEEDLADIEALGVKTVVSLRTLHTDRFTLRHTGIRAVRVPVLPFDITDDQMARVLRTLRKAERNGPVLLHCKYGADRTGTVAAMYRVVFQGWSKEEALDEFQHGGYGEHGFLALFPEYIKRVDVEALKRRIGAL